MSRVWIFVLCWLLGGLHAASAESRSFSYSIWSVVDQSVHVRFIVPTAEVRRLVDPGLPPPTTEAIARYLIDHVAVSSAAGPCLAVDQGEEIGLVYTLSSSPGQSRFEIVFQCQQENGIALQNSFLFDRVPRHVNFARVQINNGGFVSQLFTAARERIELPAKSSELSNVGMFEYVRLGVTHMLDGLDRLCFVLALLLVRWRRQDLGYLVGGLSLGYLLSVVVTVSGIIAPRMELTEALLGFMIVLVAVEAASLASGRPWVTAGLIGGSLFILSVVALFARGMPTSLTLAGVAVFAATYLPISGRLGHRPAFGLVATTLFGMLDGFGFAADLSTLRLPWRALAPMLLGFDGGAVLVAAFVAGVIVAGIALVQMRGFGARRPAFADLGAAVLAGLGIFWFIGRLYVV